MRRMRIFITTRVTHCKKASTWLLFCCYHALRCQALTITIILIIRLYLLIPFNPMFSLDSKIMWFELWRENNTDEPCVTHYCMLSTVNPEIRYTTLSHEIQVTKQHELNIFLCSLRWGKKTHMH